MNKYELFALGHYLTYWPEEKTYSEIIDIILNDDPENDDPENEITREQGYEDHHESTFTNLIDDLKNNLQFFFKEK